MHDPLPQRNSGQIVGLVVGTTVVKGVVDVAGEVVVVAFDWFLHPYNSKRKQACEKN